MRPLMFSCRGPLMKLNVIGLVPSKHQRTNVGSQFAYYDNLHSNYLLPQYESGFSRSPQTCGAPSVATLHYSPSTVLKMCKFDPTCGWQATKGAGSRGTFFGKRGKRLSDPGRFTSLCLYS